MTAPADYDHISTSNPVCPWCGAEHLRPHACEGLAGEIKCLMCGKPFEWERKCIPEWSTKKLAPCPRCGKLLTLRTDGGPVAHWFPGTFEACSGVKD